MANNLANTLITLGIFFIIAGIILYVIPRFQLPGDIVIKRKNFTFYFPLATFLLLSVILTIIFNALMKK